jgi:Ni,Fe-hydrogenase maturation factor
MRIRWKEDIINFEFVSTILSVTDKQIKYEMEHLLKKLKTRDQELFSSLSGKIKIDAHPLFKIINGEIEEWEVVEKRFN